MYVLLAFIRAPVTLSVMVGALEFAWNLNQTSYVVEAVAPPHAPKVVLVLFASLISEEYGVQLVDEVNNTELLQISLPGAAIEASGIKKIKKLIRIQNAEMVLIAWIWLFWILNYYP